jgi:hypothetical protein
VTHRLAVAALSLGFALTGWAPGRAAEEPAASAGPWRSFEGTWSASGQRHTVAIEGGALAAVVEVSGAVVLTHGEGLSRGFRGEAIGFDDGQGGSVGRAIWTDERGDRIFSRLKGEALQAGRRVVGTITGGTGRYAGLTGEYAFSWQYLLVPENGLIQGRALRLEGRVRRAQATQ